MKLPYYRQQKPYTCGPAVLRMALAGMGKKLSEPYLTRLAGTNARKGTSNFGLISCLRKLSKAYMTGYRIRYADLQKYTKLGPVIVDWMPQLVYPEHPEFQPSPEFNPEEDSHYAIVVAASSKFVTLQDPVLGRRIRISRKEFVKSWRDPTSASNHWMLVILKN
jgi:ABC-type bacteriocin/lantibiotic exporter with double-glycine peptidase domain